MCMPKWVSSVAVFRIQLMRLNRNGVELHPGRLLPRLEKFLRRYHFSSLHCFNWYTDFDHFVRHLMGFKHFPIGFRAVWQYRRRLENPWTPSTWACGTRSVVQEFREACVIVPDCRFVQFLKQRILWSIFRLILRREILRELLQSCLSLFFVLLATSTFYSLWDMIYLSSINKLLPSLVQRKTDWCSSFILYLFMGPNAFEANSKHLYYVVANTFVQLGGMWSHPAGFS